MSTVPREPTLATLLVDAINARLSEFRVSLPCKIAKYNSSDGTVDVDILLKDQKPQSDGTVELKTFPTIQDVPIQWFRCGTAWITLPLKAGDLGKLVFTDRSLSNWSASNKGEVVDPKSLSMHNFDGATFEPGLYPASAAVPSPDPDNIVIHCDGKVMLGEKGLADTNLVALANATKTELSALQSSLNNFVTIFNAHVHPSGMGPTGPSATPATPPNAVNDVKATKVYAK
jgi:hypothetical protein